MAVFPLHNIERDRECSCGKLQCSSAGKHPRLNDWQTLATRAEAQIAAWWKQWPDANVGVKCGRGSDLTVLDVDGDAGRETLRDLEMENGELPETPIAITGSGGAHYYFKFEEDVGNAVRFAPGLDVRTEGGLVVGVGSVTKRPYVWEAAFTLGELAPAKMPSWLVEIITKKHTAQGDGHFKMPDAPIHEGQGRNNLLYRLVRSLKARNLTDAAIRAAAEEINRTQCVPPLGVDELGTLIEHALRQADRPEFGNNASGQEPRDEWGAVDFSVLNESRRAAARLPVAVFGSQWARWINEVSNSKSAPNDYVATSLLCAASSLIGNARRVSPWPDWREPAHLWFAQVGLPSSGKSPAQDSVLENVRTLEREAARGYTDTLREWETRKALAKARRELWEEEVRAAAKEDREAPTLPSEAVEPPRPERPRLITNDTTPEAIASLLSAATRGLMLYRDELAGWIGSFDRYSRGSAERGFWIETYGGRPYVIDRKQQKGEPITIPYLSVAVLGGVQPDRLGNLLLEGEDDGLSARLLYSWPDPIPPSRPRGSRDDSMAPAALRRLLDLPMPRTAEGACVFSVIPLSDEAADLFQEWRTRHQEAEKSASGMFLSWLGKMPGVVLRLALTVALLKWSAEAPSARAVRDQRCDGLVCNPSRR